MHSLLVDLGRVKLTDDFLEKDDRRLGQKWNGLLGSIKG